MDDRSSSRRRRRARTTPTNKQRVVLGGTTGLVLLLIVLFAQYALGIDVLNTASEGGDAPAGEQAVVVEPGAGPSGPLVPIAGGYDGGWFQLYFTDPLESNDEADFHGSPVEAALVAALDQAERTIDVAVYELESQAVTDALIRARERDVRVRVVTDGEYGLENPDATFDQLELAGIPVVSDENRGGYMHNKFFVIDGLYVWTGSTNVKANSFYRNNNNALLIRSRRLAENYTAEFEELFNGQFGKRSPVAIPNPVITVDGTRIETIFESEGDAATRLVELINESESVRFMAFSFTEALRWDDRGTERSLMDLLRERALSGEMELQGIVEASSRSQVKMLVCAGLDVRQDGNDDAMHHKVFIFDDSIVATGSFNFSRNATNDNDENMLIIHNAAIANAYLEEFSRRWAESKPVPASAFDC